MPRYCRISEPSWNAGNSDPPFGLNESGAPLFDCLRILSGTVDLVIKETQKNIKLRTNYLAPEIKIRSDVGGKITKLIFENDLTKGQLAASLKKMRPHNKVFWETVRAELCMCLSALKQKDSVAAFLYLYRLLEKTAVVVPLLYAASVSDYSKAHQFLLALHKNPRDGELSAFKHFMPFLENQAGYRDLKIDFDFSRKPESWRRQCIDQLQKHVLNEPEIKFDLNDYDECVSIQFAHVLSFLVNLRNRMFHFSNDKGNLDLDLLGGASDLCALLVEPALRWYALVLSEVFKIEVDKI